MGAWTLIEAVNHVLKAGGDAPVNVLDDNSASSVVIVKDMIKVERLNLLIRGQLFNTRYPYMLPSTSNTILIGEEILSVDGWQEDAGTQFTVVDGKLYNVDLETDQFTESVHLKVIYDMNFEDIPTPLQFQIMASAAKSFQRRYQQDSIIDQDLQEQEMTGKVNAMEDELRGSNIDMKQKTPLGRILNSGVFGYA